jgi:hypothetical protein
MMQQSEYLDRNKGRDIVVLIEEFQECVTGRIPESVLYTYFLFLSNKHASVKQKEFRNETTHKPTHPFSPKSKTRRTFKKG